MIIMFCCRPPNYHKYCVNNPLRNIEKSAYKRSYDSTAVNLPENFARLEVDSRHTKNTRKTKINLTGTVQVCYHIHVISG